MPRKNTSRDVLPPALQDLAKVDRLWDVEEGVDLELYRHLPTPAEAADQLRRLTGTAAAEPVPFRFFGEDGTGSQYCFWLMRTDAPLEEQPVAFFGSEGELGVLAKDLPDFLLLLSRRISVFDVIEKAKKFAERPMPEIRAVAERHFPEALPRATESVVAEARALNKAFKRALQPPKRRPPRSA